MTWLCPKVAGLVLCGTFLLAGCGSREIKESPLPKAQEAPELEYRIGSSDALNIFVFGRPELSVTVPVRPDGLISMPLVEDMAAAGKTPSQLARDLEQRLGEYVRSPKVNVIVTGFSGAPADQIRVVGAAARPQSIRYQTDMTLLDVMIQVGGLAEFAAGNRARIIRRAKDKQLEIPVRLDDLLNDGDMKQNLPVLPGDVLIIPESRF